MVEQYLSEVRVGECSDIYYVDVELFGLEKYGAVYLLPTRRPAIIDTGTGRHYERILDALMTLGIAPADVEYVIPTHVHLDHAGGAGFLAQECPNAKVLVHETGAPHLIDPTKLIKGTKRTINPNQWDYYAEPLPVSEHRVETLAGGEAIDLGGLTLNVHHAPGHAPHQVILEDIENNTTFVADAAGNWFPDQEFVRALSPPTDFDLQQCLADIELIRSLDLNVLCYAHFGPTDRMENLDLYERTLVDWVDAIKTKRRELSNDEAVVDYFASRNGMSHVWSDVQSFSTTAMNVRGVLHYLDQSNDR